VRFRSHVRIVLGVIVGLIGLVFTLQNFGVLSIGDVQLFWPLLVVAFGLSRIVERAGLLAGLVLILAGGAVQLANLGFYALPESEVMRYWPLAVVLVGVWERVFSQGFGAVVESSAIAFLGLWLQLSYFGAVHVSSFRLWPLVLSVVGGVMVWRSFSARGSP
jgi:LiaF transmembrane domain/LiaI-LiaF-like transmembrane region